MELPVGTANLFKFDVRPAILSRNSDAKPCGRTNSQRATTKLHVATFWYKQTKKWLLVILITTYHALESNSPKEKT